MNESTNQLLRELAAKLGTTVEHLWMVLVRQALISGIVDLLVTIVIFIFLVWAFRFLYHKTTPVDTGKVETYSEKKIYDDPDWTEEGKFFAWLVYGILVLVWGCIILSSASLTIASFFNPEYWALHAILNR